jgi:hypothetical protein
MTEAVGTPAKVDSGVKDASDKNPTQIHLQSQHYFYSLFAGFPIHSPEFPWVPFFFSNRKEKTPREMTSKS